MSDKTIFLDRDSTLIEDHGYINHPDQVKLVDGAAKALGEFAAMGYKLIVVSNQSAVARGIVSEEVLEQIHNRLKQLLAENGACLDRIYYCPYHPDAVIPKYRKESNSRKPNPGMLLTAAKEMDIDLGQSWMIGNSNCDVEAGLRAGCKTILINHSPQPEQGKPSPDHRAVNIKEAVNIIKKHHHSSDSSDKHPAKGQQQSGAAQTQPIKTESQEPKSKGQKPKDQDQSLESCEHLLRGILEQLKSTRRDEMFGEFSIMRLMAGVVQVIVLFCLLITIWFLMSPDRQDSSVLISLGFAMVLQMMALTFYIMQERKQ